MTPQSSPLEVGGTHYFARFESRWRIHSHHPLIVAVFILLQQEDPALTGLIRLFDLSDLQLEQPSRWTMCAAA